jgi:hypothetical protein
LKGTIKRFILIRNNFAEEFQNDISKTITEYQTQGLHTEVQFSTAFDQNFNRFLFTAMVFGKEGD